MAGASAIRKLADQLTCPVCLEDYKDPRALQCLHTFCRQCLEGFAKRVCPEEELLSVSCPVCRKVTQTAEIEKLEIAFYLKSLFEIKRDLETGEGQDSKPEPTQQPFSCPTHNVAVEFYCKTCDEFLCNACICGAHDEQHIVDKIASVAPKEAEEMAMRMGLLDSKVACVEEAISEVDRNCHKVEEEETVIQEMIHKNIKQAHVAIDLREKELIEQLRQMTEQKMQNLSVQRGQLELLGTRLQNCRDVIHESLQKKASTELLKMKKPLMAIMNDTSHHLNELTIALKRTNRIAFFADQAALQTLSVYGELYIKVPNAKHCHIQGKGLSNAKVGELAEVQLSLYDDHKLEIDAESAIHTVSAELYSSTSTLVQCSVEKLHRNHCAVTYLPAMKGPHNLDVEIVGRPVKGSPFCVSIKAPLSEITASPLNIITGLQQPWGLVLDHRGRVCVAASGRKEVVIVDSLSGETISRVVKRGLLQSALEEPSGLTVDKDGNLIVADFRLSTIQRVALDGQVLQSVGHIGSKPGEFSYPAALAFNPANDKIYVSEWQENNRVQILNHDLSHYKTFGCTGSKPGEFLCPSGIAFDGSGNVYVADCNNARIQVFSCDGEYIRGFGKWGKKEGKLGLPMALCVDRSSDVLYITDVFNHRVSLFTTDGQFLRSFGSHGSGPGEFNAPQGIAVDEFRFIYVSDTHNNRVQVF